MTESLAQLEAELMPGLAERDEKSFNRLVQTYYGSMLGLARTIVGEAIADEVVQEAWVSIYRALPKFEGRSSLKTWILRITANEAKTRLRKESRTISLEQFDNGGEGILANRFNNQGAWQAPPGAWHEESPETLLINTEMGDCIEHTLHHLPDLQQAVFALKDLDGNSFEAICNILDISSSNARVLLHRARVSLFGKIEHFQETGEC
ncbi:RNA polymerase sigma factor [Motiliproteus sp. MSK22-1]|uniref:RNA polymerase sigma factor n=1 Tax=Motiliproteus sp. MSK22-1 TaxID=1897630 RepID=UPI0018E98CFB|nr:RNA polymerase sigma factor [Motiliproteus sp. MSK22-1]